ncbi:MAG: hypothetical protein AAF701_05110 [Pseudomonadota bacterium]
MRYLTVCFLLFAHPVLGQGVDGPIQDERLDIAACMIVVHDLPPSYRSKLNKACVDTPISICLVRGTPYACLRESNEQILAFYAANKSNFPLDIDGHNWLKRSYRNAMHAINTTFDSARQGPCTFISEPIAQATCTLEQSGTALANLMVQADRAGIRLNVIQ